MESLISDLDDILKQVSEKEFDKFISYVKGYYHGRDGEELNKEFTILFFETNYSTGIWNIALRNSLSKTNYNALKNLEGDDWEASDDIGSHLGNYIVENYIK